MSDDSNFLRLARRVKNVEDSYATTEYVNNALSDAGTGDMLKVVYDADDDGHISYTDLSNKPTLGDSASKNVGTASGTVAAGDHTHSVYAPTEKGVTNGDSHDHSGGDGGQIAYSSLSGTPSIPDQLSDLMDDLNHRTVTDTEKSTWNGKQDALGYTPVQQNSPITGATKTKITYDSKGLVTAGADATTADIADSTNKRYCTDAQKTVIGNTSGTNTGDETQSTIKTKLGAASSSADGYLTSADWSAFNGKQSALGYTPEDTSNKNTDMITGYSDTEYPSTGAVTKTLDHIFALYDEYGTPIVRPAISTQNYTITVGTGKDYATPSAAIASLPKEINHQITIDIYAGAYGLASFSRLSGSGILIIQAHTGETVTLSQISTESCSVNMYFYNIGMEGVIGCRRSQNIHFTNITSLWSGGVGSNGYEIYNSSVYIYGGTVSNKYNAIYAEDRSYIWLRSLTGSGITRAISAKNSIITGIYSISGITLEDYSDNSLILCQVMKIGSASFSGTGTSIVVGTAGTSDNLAKWGTTGNVIDSGVSVANVIGFRQMGTLPSNANLNNYVTNGELWTITDASGYTNGPGFSYGLLRVSSQTGFVYQEAIQVGSGNTIKRRNYNQTTWSAWA